MNKSVLVTDTYGFIGRHVAKYSQQGWYVVGIGRGEWRKNELSECGIKDWFGAESLVLQDVPPFSIALENPAMVIKRYSYSKKAWLLVSDMSTDDGIGMPSEEDYLEQIKAKFPYVNLPWIAAGKSMGDL